MATKVHMEALSPTMEEGQLVRWLKSEGDSVSNGEILAEIETDKATMELVARGEGILRKIFLGEGGTAPVGEIIAVIAGPDEDISEFEGGGGTAAPGVVEPASPDTAVGSEEGGRVKASPLARKLAAEAHLDIQTVPGSGPGGRVVMRDVEALKSSGGPGMSAPSLGVPTTPGVDFEDVPLSQMRKTIAKRLVESIGPVPHFFLGITVDMARTMAARKKVNEQLEAQGTRISINDFVLKATAHALAKHPEVNAHWAGDAIRKFYRVHLGVAVAVEDGLITPVVRDANRKGLAEISQEVRDLAARGRDKRLQPDEYTGSTFSVSNLGMFGIHEFTGIINPPEAGILAIGGIEDTPVVVDGQVTARPLMRVTMSCDHRVIDGATGARFLQTLKGMLEEPAAILV